MAENRCGPSQAEAGGGTTRSEHTQGKQNANVRTGSETAQKGRQRAGAVERRRHTDTDTDTDRQR